MTQLLFQMEKSLIAKKESLLIQKGKRDENINILKSMNSNISDLKVRLSNNDKIQILLRHVSEYAKSQIKIHVEKVVSNALNVVYGGNHKFIINIEERRNQHEIDYFLDDGFTTVKIEKPFVGKGGGKITVVSLALQLSICELAEVEGPICLDEVSKMLDQEARINLAFFLKEYSQKFNRQILLITHHSELREAGNLAIHVKKLNNGIAKVEVTNE